MRSKRDRSFGPTAGRRGGCKSTAEARGLHPRSVDDKASPAKNGVQQRPTSVSLPHQVDAELLYSFTAVFSEERYKQSSTLCSESVAQQAGAAR